jgi:DNA-binding protein H-NS
MMATAAKKAARKADTDSKRKETNRTVAAEVNWAGFSTEELRQLARDVEQELHRRRAEEKKEVLRGIREIAASSGFTLEDLVGMRPKRTRRPSAPPTTTYRNPDNPEQTWAGRGRRPEWLVGLLAQGKTLEELEFVPSQLGEFV